MCARSTAALYAVSIFLISPQTGPVASWPPAAFRRGAKARHVRTRSALGTPAEGNHVPGDVDLFPRQAERLAFTEPKSDPNSLDTVFATTTMTAAKEVGHGRQAAEVHFSWQ